MKTLTTLFILVLTLLGLFSVGHSFSIKGIVILESSNFDKALESFENLVVYFSSTECGHCGELDLAYAVLEEKYRNKTGQDGTPLVHFAKIFYEENNQLF